MDELDVAAGLVLAVAILLILAGEIAQKQRTHKPATHFWLIELPIGIPIIALAFLGIVFMLISWVG